MKTLPHKYRAELMKATNFRLDSFSEEQIEILFFDVFFIELLNKFVEIGLGFGECDSKVDKAHFSKWLLMIIGGYLNIEVVMEWGSDGVKVSESIKTQYQSE